ncbi:MAG: lysylphosphatidylglycerol synthase transmembrane domain-containing protein [Nanoarchaeota archaeon]|nr:lysylphosphatidylglycerol synthase transmembrane domain-containing protein [Nanoarchaeota archaeon]
MKIRKLLPIIGILIFLYILIRLDIRKVLLEISQAKVNFLLIAVLFIFISFLTETLKWFSIARVQKTNIPFFKAVKVNLISSFYGFITPSKVGGVIRAKYLKEYNNNVGKGVGNFILDKVLDVCSLVFLAILFSFVFREFLPINFFYYSIALLSLMIIFLFIFFDMRKSRFFLKIVYKRFIPKRWKERARKEFYSFYEDMPKKRYFFLFFLLNILNWIVLYSISFFIGKSIGINLSFFYFLAILPIATLVAQIPITISGLGTREAILITLFGLVGIDKTKVFSMSMINLFIGAVIPSAVGWILSLKNNKNYKQT